MKRIIPFFLAATLLAGPVLADSITFDLPRLSFPEPVTTLSTSDCAPATAPHCAPRG